MIGSYGGPKNVKLVLSFGKIVDSLLKMFYDEEEDDIYEKFVHLKQAGSVSDYTHEWEVLAIRQRGFKMYRCGLKEYIYA